MVIARSTLSCLLLAGFCSAAGQVGSVSGLVTNCFNERCNHWLDTDGERIEAHGAGILYDEGSQRWYWYGESTKTEDFTNHDVTCYSASDLGGPWKNEGRVLTQKDIHPIDANGPFIVARPKVLYNSQTKQYVMWFHLDSIGWHHQYAGVATADTPSGPFKFMHALHPDGLPSLDMTAWKDADGSAYFIRSVKNNYTAYSKLTDDYLNTTGVLSTGPAYEGMAPFRHDGTLYMIGSHFSGWDPNPLILYRMDGPDFSDPQWANLGNPTGHPTSFNSQPATVIDVVGAGETYHLYIADNWMHAGQAGLIDASYVWLPIHFDGKSEARIDQIESWRLEQPREFYRKKAKSLLSVKRHRRKNGLRLKTKM